MFGRKKLSKDKEGPLCQEVSMKTLEDFAWCEVRTWAEDLAPCMTEALKSIFAKPSTNNKETSSRDKKLGLVLAIALHNKRLKFVQACMGVQLWRHGCPQKMFTTLSEFGITQSVESARGQVDRLRLGHDTLLQLWKRDIETKEPTGGTRRRLEFHQPLASYSLTWDNVQVEVHGKHQSSQRQNKFLMWALCFAPQNKVPWCDLPDPATINAVDVDPFALLPASEVLHSIRDRMTTLVTRILADNMPALHLLRDRVVRHIPHPRSREMREKSNIIMEHLHNYVPEVQPGQLHPVLCRGDGLSIERMIHAKRARSNGGTQKAKLQGLAEGAQEFHKEIILLQDTMDLLFSGRSEASRVTLSQLKAFFSHRGMKAKFATCAYICLLATDLCRMDGVQDLPVDFPARKQQQLQWLTNVVVDFCWLAPDHEDIMTAVQAMGEDSGDEEIFPYCSCLEEKEETMIRCCSGNCSTAWYHLTCAGLQSAPEGDWFCSDLCEGDGTYIYCTCHKRKGGDMVQCELSEACLRDEWYHKVCLNQDQLVDIEGTHMHNFICNIIVMLMPIEQM
ncbi:ING4 [Branchiostoma lanceolatum]|uniref:ING4 protein n=1 Tax=Branchiostoma lanceolatum TaxID=7740 RepID=A0A8J9Z871_BRALA|nr:ING4 [Branchiostoma lanceolatum]